MALGWRKNQICLAPLSAGEMKDNTLFWSLALMVKFSPTPSPRRCLANYNYAKSLKFIMPDIHTYVSVPHG